ncbi:MAG: hypothetical protein ACHQ1H_04435 [Nitrososphaerales archaeon]
MARKGRVPLRLDIVGLDPNLFQESLRNAQAWVESKTKGSVSRTQSDQNGTAAENVYRRIALIALDFQRAYGRAVEIRVFERSANRVFERIQSFRGVAQNQVPEFFVNGVKIYRGLPNSFSQLDEAIENAFGKT